MIELRRLTKVYGHGPHATTVLDNLDLTVEDRSIAAVVGPSGAGKSTLAACVTLLDPPTSGTVVVSGRELSGLDERSLRHARRQIGTIFQSDGLLSRRTAAENVELPLRYLGVTAADRRRRVAELLDRVGLSDRAGHYPHQLSGGQRQRVGIARALALKPRVLLADEATSGLDPESTASVVRLLRELRDDLGLSILFITHEMDVVLELADTVARLDHGRIVEQGRVTDLLRDPASGVGRALLPRKAHHRPDGVTAWAVSYTSAEVPPDWVARAGSALGADLALLGAAIGVVDGIPVGHATVGVPAHVRDAEVASVLTSLGLHAQPAPATDDPRTAGTATLEPVA